MLCCNQGLIHITELSWDKVMTPEDVVQPGSLVHCKVIKVDKEKLHINLSLKVNLCITCPCRFSMLCTLDVLCDVL
jgi:transcriptional accessory protein Tex/SPT6